MQQIILTSREELEKIILPRVIHQDYIFNIIKQRIVNIAVAINDYLLLVLSVHFTSFLK